MDDVILRDVAEHVPEERDIPIIVATIVENTPGRRGAYSRDRIQQCRLASTTSPYDRHEFARENRERDVVEEFLAALDFLAQICHIDAHAVRFSQEPDLTAVENEALVG